MPCLPWDPTKGSDVRRGRPRMEAPLPLPQPLAPAAEGLGPASAEAPPEEADLAPGTGDGGAPPSDPEAPPRPDADMHAEAPNQDVAAPRLKRNPDREVEPGEDEVKRACMVAVALHEDPLAGFRPDEDWVNHDEG